MLLLNPLVFSPPTIFLRNPYPTNTLKNLHTFVPVKVAPSQSRFNFFFHLGTIIMAKGNMLLGYARGKVGSLVFSHSSGQQIVRPRVTPKNPKTAKQAKQRMVWATATALSAALKPIIDHSWQGVSYGTPSVREFVRRAVSTLRARIDEQGLEQGNYTIKGSGAAQPNAVQISKGSLGLRKYSVTTGIFSFDGASRSDFAVSDMDSYKAALAFIGLVPGDQLTFVALLNNDDLAAEFNGAENLGSHLVYQRIVFKAENDFEEDFDWTSVSDIWDSDCWNLEKSTIMGNLMMSSDGTIEIDTMTSTGAFAIIRSHLSESGVWQRSNATLSVDAEALTADGITVYPSYMDTSTVDNDNPWYLNQADNLGGDSGGSSPTPTPQPSSNPYYARSASATQGANTYTCTITTSGLDQQVIIPVAFSASSAMSVSLTMDDVSNPTLDASDFTIADGGGAAITQGVSVEGPEMTIQIPANSLPVTITNDDNGAVITIKKN